MITLPDREAILAALIDPTLLDIRPILERLAGNDDLLDLTFVAIIGSDDTEQDIIDAIGWSPLLHPIDELRVSEPGFEPYWDFLLKHDRHFGLIHSVGNEGFAYILLIEDRGDSALVRMCPELRLMRILGFIIVGAIGIAALRLAIIALVLVNMVALIIGLFQRPKETMGALLLLAVSCLLGR